MQSDYWAPVKEAWNLYEPWEKRVMVVAWTIGPIVGAWLGWTVAT